jgi:hypothetical protein
MNTTKASLRSKRWCATVNNFTAIEHGDILDHIRNADPVYAILARELSASGTPHLQCFVHFRVRVYFTQVKAAFCNRAHVTVAFGSDAQNRQYCLKEDKRPVEIGEPSTYTNRMAVSSTSSSSQGRGGRGGGCGGESANKNGDTHRGFLKFIDMYEATNSKSRTCYEDVDACVVYLRHHACVNEILRERAVASTDRKLRENYKGAIFNRFQCEVIRIVNENPEPRVIHWFIGNVGKSWLYLVLHTDAFCCGNVSTRDLAYAIIDASLSMCHGASQSTV